MTREEKIKGLYNLKEYLVENPIELEGHKSLSITLIDNAIEALEHEPKAEKIIKMRDATPEEKESIDKYIKSISTPTGVDFWNLEQEPCENAISRQAVLEQTYLWSKDEFLRVANPFDYLRKRINSLPPVNPQPKTGHWISHGEHCRNLGVMPSGLGAYEWCSNCDCGIDVREWHRNYYNYCPNCGAKMVEPQESEVLDADSN